MKFFRALFPTSSDGIISTTRASGVTALVFALAIAFVLALGGCARRLLPVPTDIPVAKYETTVVPQQIKFNNGLNVFVAENRELPIVSGTLTIRGGSLLDRRRGLTPAMADQMREGGAGELTGAELDTELQRLSAGINSGAGQESISVSFSCLAADLDRVFKLFSDVVLRPNFEESRLSLWRAQALEGIRRRTDEPWTVAGIAFQQLVFGNTPYGAVTTSQDVRAITRTELIKLHRAAITPSGTFLSISGAVDSKRVVELLVEDFDEWQIGSEVNSSQAQISQAHSRAIKSAVASAPPALRRDTTLPKLEFKPRPGIYFIELPLTQASVVIGQQGVARLTPDFAAIDIFNQVFGSGFFGSRLMKSVRTDQGLVYGISGGISSGPVLGRATIGFQTKTESVNAAIEAALGELLKMRSNLVSQRELREAQSSISNAFVFKFDSADEVAQRYSTLAFLNYPADYDSTYLTKIQAVTPQEVKNVALNRWDVNKLVVLVVGNKSIWEKLSELSNFEPLSRLPIKKLTFDEVLR